MPINCLYCAADCILYLRFSRKKGALHLLEARAVEGDFAALNSVVAAVSKLHLSARERRRLHVVAAELSVLVKVIPVPTVEAGEQEAALCSEALRALPLGDDQLHWQHRTLSRDAVEHQVAIVAARRADTEAFCHAMAAAGVDMASLQVVPAILSDFDLDDEGADALLRVHSGCSVSYIVLRWGRRHLIRCVRHPDTPAQKSPERLVREVERALAAGAWEQAPRPIAWEVSGRDAVSVRAQLIELLGSETGLLPTGDSGAFGLSAASSGHFTLLARLAENLIHGRQMMNFLRDDVGSAGPKGGPDWRSLVSSAAMAAAGTLLLVDEWRLAGLAEDRLNLALPVVTETVSLHEQILDQQARNQVLTARLDMLEDLARKRRGWTDFLSDLQERLHSIEDAWLDSMAVVGSETKNTSGGDSAEGGGNGVRLQISGRMIDRLHPLQRVSPEVRQRVAALQELLLQSAFVRNVSDLQLDTGEAGLLRFNCILEMEDALPW